MRKHFDGAEPLDVTIICRQKDAEKELQVVVDVYLNWLTTGRALTLVARGQEMQFRVDSESIDCYFSKEENKKLAMEKLKTEHY